MDLSSILTRSCGAGPEISPDPVLSPVPFLPILHVKPQIYDWVTETTGPWENPGLSVPCSTFQVLLEDPSELPGQEGHVIPRRLKEQLDSERRVRVGTSGPGHGPRWDKPCPEEMFPLFQVKDHRLISDDLTLILEGPPSDAEPHWDPEVSKWTGLLVWSPRRPGRVK